MFGVYEAMAQSDLFAWTRVLWRFLNSRAIKFTLVLLVSVLIFASISFRIESLLFQRRVNSLLSRMAQVRLDASSEQELVGLLPELRPLTSNGSNQVIQEGGEERGLHEYSLADSNMEEAGFLVRVLWKLHLLDSNSTIRLLFLLGHRFHRLGASAYVRDREVVRVNYGLRLENGESHGLYDGIGIYFDYFSRSGWTQADRAFGRTFGDVSPYAEAVASNAPENVVHLAVTSDAPPDLVRAALEPQIKCLWKLGICRNTKQILPGIWPPHFPWRGGFGPPYTDRDR